MCYPIPNLIPIYLRHVYSTKTFIIPVILFSILYNVSKFFELNVVEERTMTLENGTIVRSATAEEWLNLTMLELDHDNVTYNLRLQPTKLRLDSMYITIYILWMNLIFNILGPFVVLAVLNHIVSLLSIFLKTTYV